MSKVLFERVRNVEKIAKSIYRMTIESEYISQNALPGMFVNVKCSEGINALLRRPISICSVDRDKSTFDIIFQIKGIGTEYLSQTKPGSQVDLIGPLGKPFDISDEYKSIAVVGGGIGIFPLLFLLREKKNAEKAAFLGFRSIDYVVVTEEFKAASNSLFISTDDGSFADKGIVTISLENELEKKKYDIIYTCGPMPMIRKVVQIAKDKGIKCQVSLEQRMGCGIGACLVCACKTGTDENWKYSHVCKDGPVFWSNEVIFDE
ncbi:MAG: dihydroorotate dehydrogenase electron transfer subunit [Clostridiaceae bacterium]|nr:dihydroorotate dehydrogenase electron transfer subunit [Clostridiaceae bacterium]